MEELGALHGRVAELVEEGRATLVGMLQSAEARAIRAALRKYEGHYMIQPLVEPCEGCMVVLKVS